MMLSSDAVMEGNHRRITARDQNPYSRQWMNYCISNTFIRRVNTDERRTLPPISCFVIVVYISRSRYCDFTHAHIPMSFWPNSLRRFPKTGISAGCVFPMLNLGPDLRRYQRLAYVEKRSLSYLENRLCIYYEPLDGIRRYSTCLGWVRLQCAYINSVYAVRMVLRPNQYY